MQPEGLRESSRWSERSEDHRYRVVPTRTLEGCQTSLRGSRTRSGCCWFSMFSGGLRYAPTTGYSLAALWAARSNELTKGMSLTVSF